MTAIVPQQTLGAQSVLCCRVCSFYKRGESVGGLTIFKGQCKFRSYIPYTYQSPCRAGVRTKKCVIYANIPYT